MAITDNLAIRIKAETGQSVITDNIASLAVNTGTGTATLVDDGTYGLLWRLTGGGKSATLSGMGEWMNTNVTTVAMRFRVTTRSANYTRFMIMGSNSDSGLMIGNGGTSTGGLRIGVQVSGSTIGSVAPATYTAGDVLTAVIRFTEGATDYYDGWYNTVGRSGTDPNVANTGTNTSAYRARALLQFLTVGETLDIMDYAMWTRGLTNAEAAAVADDIRGTLYASGSTDGAASGAFPVVTITAPAATATGTSSGATNGASAGALPAVTVSAPAATATGTTSGAGTVSIPPITDFGTRTVLKNVPNIVADFYDLSTKALVVSVTGITSNSSTGAATAVSASLVAGTTYRTVVEFTYGGFTYRGVWNLAAA